MDLKWLVNQYMQHASTMLRDIGPDSLLKRNARFHNLHRGERCFILGSGPSIKEQALEKLNGKIVMTQNHFHAHEQIRTINPAYHVVVPKYQPQEFDNDWVSWLRSMNERLPGETILFFGKNTKYLVDRLAILRGPSLLCEHGIQRLGGRQSTGGYHAMPDGGAYRLDAVPGHRDLHGIQGDRSSGVRPRPGLQGCRSDERPILRPVADHLQQGGNRCGKFFGGIGRRLGATVDDLETVQPVERCGRTEKHPDNKRHERWSVEHVRAHAVRGSVEIAPGALGQHTGGTACGKSLQGWSAKSFFSSLRR